MKGLRLPNRLAVWLALTIVLGLFAIQLVNIGLVLLTRPEATPTVAARWLADHLIVAAATPDQEQLAASQAADELAPWFNLQWGERPRWAAERPEPPRDGQEPRLPMPLRLMDGFLEQKLGPGWRVEIQFDQQGFGFARLLQPFPTAPPPRPAGMRRGENRGEGGRDFLVPASFSVAMRAPDGRWLVAEGRYTVSGPERALYLLGYLAIFTLVIGLVAWWAARRLIRPLDRLGEAVRLLGQTRQLQPVAERGPEEVRVIARSINDMQQRIKRFLDERTAMAGAMSHDLRTPLTRLRLRAELTQDQELRAKLLADVGDIESIVDDALALARFDAPAEHKVRLDLSTLLHGLVDDAADSGQTANFAGVDGVRIDGHPVSLKRAFANLIDNAAKYGGGAEVAVRQGNGEAIVTIADQGPGIADADKDRVFDAFHRLEQSRSRDTGGTGLGLTIARSIVETHGGAITLGDAKPHGLVVTVRLPLSGA